MMNGQVWGQALSGLIARSWQTFCWNLASFRACIEKKRLLRISWQRGLSTKGFEHARCGWFRIVPNVVGCYEGMGRGEAFIFDTHLDTACSPQVCALTAAGNCCLGLDGH